MRKDWTGPEEKQLAGLAEAGVPAAEIAEVMNRTKNSIYDKAQKLGVRLQYPRGEHHPRCRVPDDVVQGVRLLNGCGISAGALARLLKPLYGISPTYIQYVCNGERRPEVPEQTDNEPNYQRGIAA